MNIMRGMARNPLDPNSPNFNPMLQSQLENYSAQGWRVNEQGQALDGPLAGQNLVSGFGTNDVTAQLRKRLQKIRMRKMKQTDASMAKQQEILDAIKKQTIGEMKATQEHLVVMWVAECLLNLIKAEKLMVLTVVVRMQVTIRECLKAMLVVLN